MHIGGIGGWFHSVEQLTQHSLRWVRLLRHFDSMPQQQFIYNVNNGQRSAPRCDNNIADRFYGYVANVRNAHENVRMDRTQHSTFDGANGSNTKCMRGRLSP